MPKGNCQFHGRGGHYFPTFFIHGFLLTFITLGLYWPWAWVKILKLKASHTVINGKQVSFIGTGGQLFPLILVQGILTVITFGLYAPWAICNYYRWKLDNTLVGDNPSQFNGTGGSLFLFYLIHMMLLPMLTLGIYSFWGLYRFYAWKEEHSNYGGKKTSFGAGFGGFLKVTLITYFLNVLTLNLFTPWAICLFSRWQMEGLMVGDEDEVQHFPPVKANLIIIAVLILIGLLPFIALGFFIMSKYEEIQKIKSQIVMMERKGVKGKTIKRPIKKVPPRIAKKPPLSVVQRPIQKPSIKEAPKPTPPLPRQLHVEKPVTQKEIDYESEMKRLNDLIAKDDKNADAFYNRGWLYANKGDLQMAEKDYTKAIEINPRHENAYYNRGLLFVKMRKHDLAIRDFSEAIKLNTRAMDAYCNRGSAHFQLGKIDLAIEDFNAALKIDPKDGDVYYNRALAYLAKGDKTKAMRDFHKAAKLGHIKARLYLKMPPLKKTSTSLRAAAIECRVTEFIDYMPSDTNMKIQRFESIRLNVKRNLDELYQQAHQLFGNKVQRIEDSIRFSIEGKDPRWVEFFGPQWTQMIKQRPNEPRFFMIQAQFGWDQECRVLQKFQACIEDPQFCQDTPEEGSALQMKKIDGAWKLVNGKALKEWKQAFLFGEGLVEILRWAKQHLIQGEKQIPYEELMLSLAKGYIKRIQSLMGKVAKVN